MIALALTLAQTPLSPHSALITKPTLTCRDWALAANAFLALGERRASAELKAIAAKAHVPWSPIPVRAGLLCRLLFVPKRGRALRPPMFGGLMLPYRSMPEASWPEYPLVRQDGVWFLLSESYYLAGEAETVSQYLSYCRKAGNFRSAPLPLPTSAQASRALEELLASRRWRAIRWSHEGVYERYHTSASDEAAYLKEQVTF